MHPLYKGEVKSEIVQAGNPVLRQKASPIEKKDLGSRKLQNIISRMKKLLKKEEFGVAIAAPQVGEPLRVFIVAGKAFAKQQRKRERGRREYDEEKSAGSEQKSVSPDIVFINPELVRLSKKKEEVQEGCLSVRGVYGTVLRHQKTTVRALDEEGKPFVHHGSGLIAQIFQHELDHLEGILFTDKAEKLDHDKK